MSVMSISSRIQSVITIIILRYIGCLINRRHVIFCYIWCLCQTMQLLHIGCFIVIDGSCIHKHWSINRILMSPHTLSGLTNGRWQRAHQVVLLLKFVSSVHDLLSLQSQLSVENDIRNKIVTARKKSLISRRIK